MPAERSRPRRGDLPGPHSRPPAAPAGDGPAALLEPRGAEAPAQPARPALSEEFFRELDSARRRVGILEEANRAVHHLVDRIARLSAFSEGLERRGSIDEVADLLFDEVRDILPVECLALALGGQAEGRFAVTRVSPAAAAEAAQGELEAQAAEGVVEWALGLCRPVVVPAARLGKSLVLLPLSAARRSVGVLMAATALPAGALAREHLMLGAVVARQAGECIDNLCLAEDLRRQNEAIRRAGEEAVARRVADLGLLVEAARTLSGALDRDAALRHLLEETCRHLGVSMVVISLLEPDGRLAVAASVGVPSGCLDGMDVRIGDGGLIPHVVERAEPVVVPDVSGDPRTRRSPGVRAAAAAAFLGVPLVAREQVIGVLSVMADVPRTFLAEEVALLTGLAAQGALAIENARLVEDLQRRMAEQERALGRLVQSARMASVGLLAGGVAHDINNPLCIISNHLQLLGLRRNQLAPDVASAVNVIEANVHRIANSIQGLQSYAAGRPGERQPTDLNEATSRVLLLLQNHTLYRRLRVTTDFAPDLPPVNLDRAAWEQVVMELLTNAREAMPEGGTVRVVTRRLPRAPAAAGPGAEEWVEVVVEDEGPGIAAADLPRVFDPFFTTKGPTRGMGLGLRICRDIIREHGGHLLVESDGRSGTQVVVELPAAAEA